MKNTLVALSRVLYPFALGLVLGAALMFLLCLAGCRPRDDGDNNQGGNGHGRWSLHEHGDPLQGRGPKNPSGH